MTRKIIPTFSVIAACLLVAAVAIQIVLAAPAQKHGTPPQPQRTTVSAEGRVVGRAGFEATVGTEIAGVIEEVRVTTNQPVKKGEVIASIRADELRASVAEAEARVAEAESDLRLFESEIVRARELWQAEVGTRQAYERALRDSDSAQARRATAAASLERLRAALRKSEIVAPIDGIVVERLVDPGETVEAGAPIATILDPRRVRVEAEVDEFDVARIESGAAVRIRADGFDRQWNGRVEEIPMRVVGRSIRPNDPAQPVDVRVLLVGVALLEETPLKIGQRVDVEIAR
jgi:HlyD family secretion protein